MASTIASTITAVNIVLASVHLSHGYVEASTVVRKCDQSAAKGLTNRAKVRWDWPRLRFVVDCQSITFTLNPEIYTALDITPIVETSKTITGLPYASLTDEKTSIRPTSILEDSGPPSLLQELVKRSILHADNIRIEDKTLAAPLPDNVTAAPQLVDGMAVLLSCIAMGMQVYQYSPRTHQVLLADSHRSVTSSSHPVLGGLLHYNVFPFSSPSSSSSQPKPTPALAALHARALHHPAGVWAAGVFGLFRDRSHDASAFTSLRSTRRRHTALLEAAGWPADSTTDTAGGAASCLQFAHADAYLTPPPSVSRRWCAHFAESIVKWHHVGLLDGDPRADAENARLAPAVEAWLGAALEQHGATSPHIALGGSFPFSALPGFSSTSPSPLPSPPLLFLAPHSLLTLLPTLPSANASPALFLRTKADPSAYLPPATAFAVLQRADLAMALLTHGLAARAACEVRERAQRIAARAMVPLAEVAAPSWGADGYKTVMEGWMGTLVEAEEWGCAGEGEGEGEGMGEGGEQGGEEGEGEEALVRSRAKEYARCVLLRGAYYTVMMRATGDKGPGPGLEEEGEIETGRFGLL